MVRMVPRELPRPVMTHESLNQPNSNPSSIGSNRRSLPPSYDAMFGSKTTVESIFKNDSFKNSKQTSFDDEAESVKGLSDSPIRPGLY